MTAQLLARHTLCGLGGALAIYVVVACFRAYLDPALIFALTNTSFLCQ